MLFERTRDASNIETPKGSGASSITDGALAHFYIRGNPGFDGFVEFNLDEVKNLADALDAC